LLRIDVRMLMVGWQIVERGEAAKQAQAEIPENHTSERENGSTQEQTTQPTRKRRSHGDKLG
jgi:hypothetical protein